MAFADREASAGRKVTPKKRKPTPAPRTDVQTSGKNYGLPKAKRVATSAPSPRNAFNDPLMAGGAMHEQVRQEHAKVRDVENALSLLAGPTARLRRFPVLGSYTGSQRKYIDHTLGRQVAQLADELVSQGEDPDYLIELARLADDDTRRALHKAFGRREPRVYFPTDDDEDSLGVGLTSRAGVNRDRVTAALEDVTQAVAGTTADALDWIDYLGAQVPGGTGSSVTAALRADNRGGLGVAGRVFKNTARAASEDPGAVAVNSLKSARDMAAALPAGIVAAIHDPEDIPKQVYEDLKHRYGLSDAEMVEEIKTRGVTSYALDAATVASLGGSTLGRGTVSLARRGAFGDKLRDVAGAARPKLRTSGGTAHSQPLADRPVRILLQRSLDKRRAAKDERLAAAARDGESPAEAVRVQAASADAEVSPYFDRTARKAQRHDVALRKGRALQLMRSEQFRTVDKATRKKIDAMSKPERTAFYHVAAGILPADPAGALQAIPARRAYIVANREAAGVGPVNRKTDELRDLDYLEKNADAAFTERLGDLVRELRPEHLRVAAADPALTAHQRLLRRYAQQAEHLGIRRGELDRDGGPIYEQESTADFIRRVQAAADAEGLERPLYFPSEKYALVDNPDLASRTVGGHKAMGSPFKYTGRLFREGRQDTSPETYLTGLARSIKRKHNWALVADQFEAHTLPGFRNMTMGQLKNKLAREGIDMASVEFWNPRLYRKSIAGTNVKDDAVRNLEAPNRYGDRVAGDEELQIERVQHAVQKAQTPPEPGTPEYSRSRGWSVVPKEAHREIHATINTSGLAAIQRRSQRFFQTWPSRILLGMNPLWNAFQVGSNVLLGAGATGLKHGGLPAAIARQARLYHVLDADSKSRVDALIGEGAGAHGNKVRLGSTAGPVSRKVNRMLASPKLDAQARVRGVPVTPSLRQLNLIEAGFKADRFQNARFRRALLFHSMKSYGEALTPARVKEILDNPEMANANAQFVSDWLGDYSTYTRYERAAQGFPLTPLFYGYLRHSLSLVFRTLPRDNPLLLEAAMQLGHLQAEDLRELGVEGLPWSAGKFYWTDDEGQLKEFDLARLNPAMNAVTGLRSPSQLAGVSPPVWGLLADQVAHRNIYFDRPWAVAGDPADPMAKSADFTAGQRARIALDRLLSLSNPVRVANRHLEFGPQGDDSLFGDRPTERVVSPRNVEERARDAEWIAEDREEAANWLQDLIPLPRVSRDQEIAKARRKAEKKPRKIESFTRSRPTIGTGSGPKVGSGRPTIGGG